MSTVLVTDAGRGSAVAFIRSLDRAGHRVVAGDASTVSPGRWSRSSSVSFRYPDPMTDAGGAAEAIFARIVDEQVDVVLPMTDATTRVVTSLAARLPSSCRIGAAPAGAAEVVADKDRTVQLARQLAVPVPATVVVDSAASAVEAAASLGWPVVVKPISSLASGDDGTVRKFVVGYGRDPDDLERAVASLGGGSQVLLQEFCAGDGIGVEVLAHQGRVLRSFAHRRLHEVPVTGGASALRESISIDPELDEHVRRLIDALSWTGLAMVEFKVGRDGPRLMEINGRPWGSIPLAVLAGVDFPADYVSMLADGADALPAQRPYEVGAIARNLRLETVWIGSVLRGPSDRSTVHRWPPRRAALAAALRLFSPRVSDDVVSWRDPKASAAELLWIMGNLAGKVAGTAADMVSGRFSQDAASNAAPGRQEVP